MRGSVRGMPGDRHSYRDYVKGGLVMVSELSDKHRIIAYLIDKAMLIIDASRPVAG